MKRQDVAARNFSHPVELGPVPDVDQNNLFFVQKILQSLFRGRFDGSAVHRGLVSTLLVTCSQQGSL